MAGTILGHDGERLVSSRPGRAEGRCGTRNARRVYGTADRGSFDAGATSPDLKARLLFAMAAAAPPIGLLLLGFTFDNAPIELRYLAFATPYIGLLLAAALPRHVRHAVLAIQAIALLGLMARPETMQPARATAIAAAALVGDGVVLLPRGNDGVGIVGAFAVEAPPTLRLLVIGRDVSLAQIRARFRLFPRDARLARTGRSQSCDVVRDAPRLRRSVLARRGRRVQRPHLRPDLQGGMSRP